MKASTKSEIIVLLFGLATFLSYKVAGIASIPFVIFLWIFGFMAGITVTTQIATSFMKKTLEKSLAGVDISTILKDSNVKEMVKEMIDGLPIQEEKQPTDEEKTT